MIMTVYMMLREHCFSYLSVIFYVYITPYNNAVYTIMHLIFKFFLTVVKRTIVINIIVSIVINNYYKHTLG